uniref:TIR domain-containing protein n=1 Tax=Candidatus Kentrum sp. LFY TaxID=2126342 RepID=A0A450UY55_9GAMM|nr:MAG: TIR domain-containing protein [Candidatus Kentron sp. LFY]
MKTTHYDAFLSHRGENKPWVEALARNLQRAGHGVFLDIWNLVPGRSLAGQLDSALGHSGAGILVATPESLESSWVRDEYDKMLALRNRSDVPPFTILPLVFGEIPNFPFLENHLCIDFSDPSPAGYGKAFRRLLCGLAGTPPGDVPGDAPDPFPFDLQIPEPMTPRLADMPRQPLATGEAAFVGKIFDTLATGQPVLLLAQEGRDRLGMHQAILERARCHPGIGRENCHHLVPPSDPDASLADYFAFIARQAGFPGDITSAMALEFAIEDHLRGGAPLFLFITRLVAGSPDGRQALARMLRNLNERYGEQLRIVLCGSEQLAALRFANGEHSLLDGAEALYWPEPTVADLRNWRQAFPGSEEVPGATSDELPPEVAEGFLAVTGGHPQLLHKCLRQWMRAEDSDCAGLVRRDLDLAALFTRYRQGEAGERSRLRDWLNRERIASYDYWPGDDLLRRLFWDNLLAERDGMFAWRCGGIRDIGIRVMDSV